MWWCAGDAGGVRVTDWYSIGVYGHNPLDVGLYEPVVHYELYLRLFFLGNHTLAAKQTRPTHTVELVVTLPLIPRKERSTGSVPEVTHTIQRIPNPLGNMSITVRVFVV